MLFQAVLFQRDLLHSNRRQTRQRMDVCATFQVVKMSFLTIQLESQEASL